MIKQRGMVLVCMKSRVGALGGANVKPRTPVRRFGKSSEKMREVSKEGER